MDNPLVSIITPCYNGEAYVSRYFESILWQDYDNCEVIFVNDGSNDKTEDLAYAYGEKIKAKGFRFIYLRQENAGQAAALQNGLWKAKGKYITWPDSDDQIMPKYISSKVAYMEDHPECAMCYGRVDYVNEDNPEIVALSFEKRNTDSNFFEDCLFHSERICYNGYFVRTESVDAALKNREIVVCRGGQNLQLMLPLGWYYGEPGYVADSVYKYFIRDNSHSREAKSSFEEIKLSENYERICREVVEQISDHGAEKYDALIREKFSRVKFSYAIDTGDRKILKKYYMELRQNGCPTFREKLLFLKYGVLAFNSQ